MCGAEVIQAASISNQSCPKENTDSRAAAGTVPPPPSRSQRCEVGQPQKLCLPHPEERLRNRRRGTRFHMFLRSL